MTLRYWQVDAFADRPFTGNPAGVVLLDAPLDDAAMQALSREIGLPATAFVAPDRMICWWSSAGEIALCGHATLASAHVLLQDGGDRVDLRTRGGETLEVRRDGRGYALALPAIRVERADTGDGAALPGATPLETWRSVTRQIVHLFADESAVRALEPDFAALARGANDQHICTAPGERTDIVSRVFIGGAGAAEDAVTGSAHAALTPFWAARLGRDRFTAHQASSRGGDLTCRLDGDRAWLTGRCVTVIEGRLYLPG